MIRGRSREFGVLLACGELQPNLGGYDDDPMSFIRFLRLLMVPSHRDSAKFVGIIGLGCTSMNSDLLIFRN